MPGSWVLDESKDSARHELRTANGRATPCYLCDRDHSSSGRDLDAPAGTRRLNVVSTYVTAGVDNDLYAVTLHDRNNVSAAENSP
jgi:hypothetical protein